MSAHKNIDVEKIKWLHGNGIKVKEISKITGCSRANIYYLLNKNDIKSRQYKKHGTTITHVKLYRTWFCMVSRCENKNNSSYKNYGGRGIFVCEEWKHSFDNFYEWAEKSGYCDGLEIDREDNNSGYEPSNCRWVTRSINARNRRDVVLNPALVSAARIAFAANIKTQTQIAAFFNVNKATICSAVTRKTWKDVFP